MSRARTIHLPEIGAVLFEKSSKARRINITVRPIEGIRVAIPIGVPFEKARQIAQEKAGWIQARQEEAREMERRYEQFGQRSNSLGRTTAKPIIVNRLKELADRQGISYNRVFVRSQKTRWGSCSSQNNISLNYKIALLPSELMDYVLLHELMHIKYFHHGKRFWEALDRVVGNARAMEEQLKKYQALLLDCSR